MIDSIKPAKALWFLAINIQLCTNAGAEVGKNEERIKEGLAILARALDEASQKELRKYRRSCSPLAQLEYVHAEEIQ